jgi:hypothetical protein
MEGKPAAKRIQNPGAILVPSQPVQTGQQGSFVFVVQYLDTTVPAAYPGASHNLAGRNCNSW